MNDPELTAMSTIADTLIALPPADAKRIVRWPVPTTDTEVEAQGAVLAALQPLRPEQRQRVVRWAVARFSGPAERKGGRPKSGTRAKAERTIPERIVLPVREGATA